MESIFGVGNTQVDLIFDGNKQQPWNTSTTSPASNSGVTPTQRIDDLQTSNNFINTTFVSLLAPVTFSIRVYIIADSYIIIYITKFNQRSVASSNMSSNSYPCTGGIISVSVAVTLAIRSILNNYCYVGINLMLLLVF